MLKKVIFPLLAAMIWGTGFVAQSMGAAHVPAFAFNAGRSVIAVMVLTVILLTRRQIARKNGTQAPKSDMKSLLLGGLCCGTAMCVGTALQQIGLTDTNAGKASFISAMYIVLVPIFGLLLGRKASKLTLLSVVITVAGMYLLCVSDGFTIQRSDILIMLCAASFAVHILVIDHFAPKSDCIALSLVQFAVMAIESTILSVFFENPTWTGFAAGLGQILYLGIFSSGVAYTLQIVAQKDADPTVVSLLLSLEAVFGTLSGALILHETMSGREYLGCGLMLIAVMLAQLPADFFRKKAVHA